MKMDDFVGGRKIRRFPGDAVAAIFLEVGEAMNLFAARGEASSDKGFASRG